jgi:hypothetical protein
MTNPVAGALAWLFIGAVYYWIGWREQRWPRRGQGARVRRRPAWLDRLCGLGPGERTLHLPMAVLQCTGVAMMVGGPAVVLLAPYDSAGYRTLSPLLLASTMIPFAIAELLMLVRRV